MLKRSSKFTVPSTWVTMHIYEIAVSGGHTPQPAAKKIKSCACSVALGAHEQAFKAMKVTGTVLKKRQRYKAKGDADCLHRDIQAQNAWLLANIFDASGNYLYCAACIVSVLGVRNIWPDYAK